MAAHELVLVLDFGSQYTQLIARRVRELKAYCEIHPCTVDVEFIRSRSPKAIVLSGGPASLTDPGAPRAPEGLWSLDVPMLGICYGMQLMAHHMGGEVKKAARREYGHATIAVEAQSAFFAGVAQGQGGAKRDVQVWMSHGDQVARLPEGFRAIGETANCPVAAMEKDGRLFGVQFHPEVSHTPEGMTMLANFVYKVAGCRGDWTTESFIEESVQRLRAQIGQGKVVLGLSGGVDSAVAAALLSRAIGGQLTCILVDNGLLRKNEAAEVAAVFRNQFDAHLIVADASESFLSELAGAVDPEAKRKIIGRLFIEVFEAEAKKLGAIEYLGQGTIYPDVIESTSFKGPSATIKSHHNVGGLPARMNMKLIEPLRELFKDEVRKIGLALGLPESLVMRHPFPGPGLAVRVLGEVTRERCDLLREADHIYIEEIRRAGWYDRIAQAFCVLLPVKAVGVMGDERTHENVLALRAVNTLDFMTADWTRLPYDLLARISNRIINEVRGINRVVYDVSSKPPATIEWE
ncbi:MAG: glutamine-hydrolyzing GMP synthase [Myxococcales bacterium]|nr:MAG: glutamine-hydrolyzing GMP synthase [Myxococcales bacterium]